MFELLIESTRNKKRGRRWAYFLATSAIWMMVFSMVIIAGIVVVDAQLSESVDVTDLIATPPPPAVCPPPSGTPRQPRQQPPTGMFAVDKTPTEIAPPQPKPLTFITQDGGPGDDRDGVDGGVPKGDPRGVVGGVLTTSTNSTPPPPRPDPPRTETPPQPPPQKPVVRSVILQGTATNRVQPTYPPLARTANVSGAVVVEVTIDEQGNVAAARVLSGHMLLRDVSRNAALGWKWRPTMLNGTAVKVIGTITFNFQK